MRFGGIGVPELLILLVVIAITIGVIILIVRAIAKPDKGYTQTQAYRRLTELDDLHKRGILTDEEYQQRKQEALKDL